MSQKVGYTSMMVDPVINVYTPNELKIHLHICDHSIINFGTRWFCLGFKKTSHVDSLDGFRNTFADQVKFDISLFIEVFYRRKYKNKICKWIYFKHGIGWS